MRTGFLTVGLTLVLLTTAAPNSAAAGQQKIRWEFSGSYVNTASDTNGDGGKGALSMIGLKGTFGPSTAQAVAEYAFIGQATCPNGNAGFTFTILPGGQAVHRIESTGDLIIGEFTSATLCFDPITLVQFVSGTEIVTGGTGRFANVTGSLEFEGTAVTLFEDGVGNFFGQQSGVITGTINIPKAAK